MRNLFFTLLLALVIWPAPVSHLCAEQMEQETIVIKGNRELPKTLYIAPWKRVGEPLDSDKVQVDIGEEASPVERDLFLYELELNRQGYSTEGPSPASPTNSQPSVGH